jgi:ABC-2 type transport system permease protein
MTTAAAPSIDRPARGPTRDPDHATRPATSALTSLWTLYTLTLRQHLRGKRWMVAAGLFLLPAVLAAVIRSSAPNAPPAALEFIFAFMFIPQALLPLVALLYASGIIQDEQEEQTITYLLIRPIRKWALYVVKLLATLTTTVVMTALFTALTYAAIYWHSTKVAPDGPTPLHRCLIAIGIHSLSVIAYCCLFGMLSLLTRRTLIAGIVYAALVEGLLANMPLSIRLVTIIYYARIIAYRSMPFLIPTPVGNEDVASDAWHLDTRLDPQLLDHPTLGACVKVLLIASAVLALFAAWQCSRKEFHVKTPEKG